MHEDPHSLLRVREPRRVELLHQHRRYLGRGPRGSPLPREARLRPRPHREGPGSRLAAKGQAMTTDPSQQSEREALRQVLYCHTATRVRLGLQDAESFADAILAAGFTRPAAQRERVDALTADARNKIAKAQAMV